ncbi:MAG: hypothetical protein V3T05_11605, partial [Myxococcota bacterium]
VFIHFIAALNYMSMGDTSAARVEARQVTDKLELYNSKYTETKNAYRDDAFARWLSGKLAETEGGQVAFNDAWIDYQRSIEVYETEYGKRYRTALPRLVIADAKRVLEALGADFAPELSQLESKYPSVTFQKASEVASQGEVVFIHLAGESPYKKDEFWSIYDNDPIYIDVHSKKGHGRLVVRGRRKLLFRVAFPEYVAKRPRIVRSQISIAGGGTANSEMMENITAIAIQNLNDHMGRIKAKAITRAITKYIAAKVAQEGGKALAKKKGKVGAAGAALQLAGVAFQIGSAIAEEADKRSWITLPAAVSVARIYAPPGKQQLQIALQSGNGVTMSKVTLPVEVQPGKTTFVAYRTFR